MKNTELTINEALALVGQLNGLEAVREVLKGREFEPLEHGGITLGQAIAAVSKVGGMDNFCRLLSAHKLELAWHEDLAGDRTAAVSVVIEELPAPLFDYNGRRIPPKGLRVPVSDPNRSYHIEQPKLDYAARYRCLEDTGLVPFISMAHFEGCSTYLLDQVRQNVQVAKLLSGVHLPIIIPPIVTPPEKIGDYGEVLEEFVLAAEKSYRRQYPGRGFDNRLKGELAGQITIVPGSRHNQLLNHLAQGTVVGIYFPNPLPRFPVLAQREQMATLPEGFLLAGGIDTCMGWVMYPDVLARGYNTLWCGCSALQLRSSDCSPCFEAYDDRACFDDVGRIGLAYDYSSGGLLFVGNCL